MVASDTLVGLVGAGILLVALAGVFVFESKQTSTTKDVVAVTYNEETKQSTLTYTAPSGVVNPLTGGCAVQGQCQPAKVKVAVSLENAPELPGPSGLYYVASLKEGAKALVLGSLTFNNGKYTLNSDDKTVDSSYTSFLVSLERTKTPATPSALVVFTKAVTVGTTAGSNADLNQKAALDWGQGSAEARLAETDQGLQVDLTFKGAKNYTSAGYVYRAWLHDAQQSIGYVFLGNLTNSESSTLSVVASGSIDTYEHLFVTLEPKDSPTPMRAATAGGPVLFSAKVAPEEVSPLPR